MKCTYLVLLEYSLFYVFVMRAQIQAFLPSVYTHKSVLIYFCCKFVQFKLEGDLIGQTCSHEVRKVTKKPLSK